MDIAQEMLKTFNDNPDLLKNFITGDESWAITLKPKPNYLIGSVQKSSDRKKQIQVRHDFLPTKSYGNKEYHLKVMYWFREANRQ